ncbi:MAG: hypothetical protein R2851_24675 [Caldilineaceae bacterium]
MLSRSRNSVRNNGPVAEQTTGRSVRMCGYAAGRGAEYRRKAAAGDLHKIAPSASTRTTRRGCPSCTRRAIRGTLPYSSPTPSLAHELDKTDDGWSSTYEKDGDENQATVITATRGALEGKRIVRGRETECQRYYAREQDEQVREWAARQAMPHKPETES